MDKESSYPNSRAPFHSSVRALHCILLHVLPCILLAAVAVGQRPPRIDGLPSAWADFLRDAERALLDRHRSAALPTGSDGRTDLRAASGPLLAWLRFDRPDLAAELLAAERAALRDGSAGADGARWAALHHYWFARWQRDAAWTASALPVLERCLAEDGAEDERDAGSDRAVLAVQAAFALGGLHGLAVAATGADAARRGAELWTRRGLWLLLDLERRCWDEEASRFSGRGAAGAAEGLFPCWIGMLTTTGDKTVRNATAALARASLPAPGGEGDGGDLLATCSVLVALTQFEGRERMAVAAQVLERASAALAAAQGPVDVLAIGAAVDALSFAVTGLRCATSPGLDENWLRCRPELPDHATAVTFRALRHDGRRFDLELAAGAPGTLDLTLRQLDAHDERPHLLVVQRGENQWQDWLRSGSPVRVRCAEPVRPPLLPPR